MSVEILSKEKKSINFYVGSHVVRWIQNCNISWREIATLVVKGERGKAGDTASDTWLLQTRAPLDIIKAILLGAPRSR